MPTDAHGIERVNSDPYSKLAVLCESVKAIAWCFCIEIGYSFFVLVGGSTLTFVQGRFVCKLLKADVILVGNMDAFHKACFGHLN